MKKTLILIFIVAFATTFLCKSSSYAEKRKVLYVDSYHAEYEPGIIQHKAVIDILEPAGVEVKFVYMDAKRKKSDEMLRKAALRAKDVIESWKPDIVIASDDAASKFLVKPYYRDADLPFVFIGVNWEVEQYEFPYKNVTGQIEVELVHALISELKKYSRGGRVGFLAGKTLTDQKALNYYLNVLNIRFDKVEFVENFKNWKKSYKSLQNEVDILLFRNNSGIAGWNNQESKKYIMEHTSIPTGSVATHLYPWVLISYAKMNKEFGEYGARTALEILKGKSPGQIPISTNKQAKVYLNMGLAKKMKIRFPMELIERAHMVSAEQKKLLYVNSYHKGYKWSDDIETGLLKALGVKIKPDGTFDSSQNKVELRVFRMDTKHNTSVKYKKKAALSVKAIIDKWKPDIVVASDDNASRYLISPYYKNASIPFVFCGLNWDATVYGFPASNITGMTEIAPYTETVEMLKKYAKGSRIGIIGSGDATNRKEIIHLGRLFVIKKQDVKLVTEFDDWKKEYSALQASVDMVILINPIGIKGWDRKKAIEFIHETTKIPTGSASDNNIFYSLLGRVKIAEEQGWWSGKTAIRILDGVSPTEIPVVKNKKSRLFLNMRLAKRLGIKFPISVLKEATLVEDIKK